MNSFIIIMVVGILLCILAWRLRENDTKSILCGVFGLVFVLLASWAVPVGLGLAMESDYRESGTSRTDLLSIKDNSTISGHFFLGSGYIGTQMYYFYYVREADGAISLRKMRTVDAKLYEDSPEGEGYILREYQFIPEEVVDSHSWVFFADGSGERPCSVKTTIHVPEGTVLRQFVLDAE